MVTEGNLFRLRQFFRGHAAGFYFIDNLENQTLRGVAFFRRGSELEATSKRRAEAAYRRAIGLAPDYVDPYLNLGAMLCDSGRCVEAVGLYRDALRQRPDEALLCYQRILQLNPRDWQAASKSGLILHQAGRFQDAYVIFDLCNELQPNHVPSLFMRGRALIEARSAEPGAYERTGSLLGGGTRR